MRGTVKFLVVLAVAFVVMFAFRGLVMTVCGTSVSISTDTQGQEREGGSLRSDRAPLTGRDREGTAGVPGSLGQVIRHLRLGVQTGAPTSGGWAPSGSKLGEESVPKPGTR